MILYRDQKHGERLSTPAWLVGAADLHIREDANGRIFGIGDGRLVGPAPDKAWTDIEDGIQGRLLKSFVPILLLRKPIWCPLHSVTDQQGRQWMVPQILSAEDVCIQATYGPGWKPDYIPQQALAIAVAKWARQSTVSEAAVPVSEACKAAAELLSTVYHLSPETIAALRLMDQGLMLSVVRWAAGFTD